MKRKINLHRSRFTWSDIERIKRENGVDTVWVCLDNDADALLVRVRLSELCDDDSFVIIEGSVLGPFDGVASTVALFYRKECEEGYRRISGRTCVKDVVTCSFRSAAMVATGDARAGAECWFRATPESLSGQGVVDVAQDAPDNPFINLKLVGYGAP